MLFVEVPPRLPADWVVLTDKKITAEEWVSRWHDEANRQFESSPGGGDFVELNLPGLEHNSFTDEVLLRAAKAQHLSEYDDAVEALRLIEDTTRTFLRRAMDHDVRAELISSAKLKVKHFPAKGLRGK